MDEYQTLLQQAAEAHNSGNTGLARELMDKAYALDTEINNLSSTLYNKDGVIVKNNDGVMSLSSPEYSTNKQDNIQRFLNNEVTVPQLATGVYPKEGMDLPASLGTGMLRGVKGILELPETIGSLGKMGYDYVTGNEVQPFPEKTYAGEAFDKGLEATTGINPQETNYRSPQTSGQYAGTIGEFLPAAAGGASNIGRRIAVASTAGAGSEAAGQLTEGTGYEPYARLSGALFAPWLGAKTLQTGNKTVNFFMKKSGEAPSIENLRQAKNAAYKAVDDSDIKFTTEQVDDFILDAIDKVEKTSGYVPEVDKQTAASIEVLLKQSGKEMSFGDLDKIRQGLQKRFSSAPNEIGISSIIDDIDSFIASNPSGDKLVKVARLANARYKKSELLENSLIKAERQAQASGTGGNIVNKYRQAVNSIINNPKHSKFFSKDEIAFMDKFVRGDVEENVLRLIGRLSPNANGLMAAVNVGAVAYNPALLPISIGGLAGKSAGEARSRSLTKQIQQMIATGAPPQEAASIAGDMTRIILGSQAGINAEDNNPQNLPSVISNITQ